MKKALFITTAIILVIASCICLMACGNDSDDGVINKDLVGHYYTESMSMNGEVDSSSFVKDLITLDLNADGTFAYNPNGGTEADLTMTGEWRYKDNKVTLKMKDSTMTIECKNNKLILSSAMGEYNVTFTLVKE